MTPRSVKPLPSWLPAVILAVALIVAAGYVVFFTQINKKRVVGVYLEQANALKRHDNYGAAAETLQKAILLDPGNIQAQTEQLKATIFKITKQSDPLDRLLNLEKIDEAEADCKRLLNADPQSAELTALLGIIYAHKDRPALAIETYKKASEMKPGYPNVRNYWGYTMVQWQFPNDWKALATQKFNEAKELDSAYVNPRVNLARLAIVDNQIDAAISMLSEAEKVGRDNEILNVLWGYSLVALGEQVKSTDKIVAYKKFSEGLERYRIAEALNPNLLAAHFFRADTLAELESNDAAIDEYKRAIELEPSFVEAHKNLAQVLLKRNTQPTDQQEALNHLNLAVSFTNRVIQQYKERRAKTPETHAQSILDQWTVAREKDKAELEKMIAGVTNGPETTRGGGKPSNRGKL